MGRNLYKNARFGPIALGVQIRASGSLDDLKPDLLLQSHLPGLAL